MQALILYALLGCARAQEHSSIYVLNKYLRKQSSENSSHYLIFAYFYKSNK